MTHARYLLSAALWLLLACPMAAAQALWAPSASGFSVEVVKPMLSMGSDTRISLPSTATFFSGRRALSSEFRLVAEVPLAHLGMTYTWFGERETESSTGLGNPYLGVEYAPAGSEVVVEAGLRAPLASRTETAMLIGSLADPDRMEAFSPDYASATLAANVLHAGEDGIRFRGRVAPSVLYYTHKRFGIGQDRFPDAREVLVSYGAEVSFPLGPVEVSVAPTGRVLITDGSSFADRSTHQVGLGAAADLGGVRSGLYVRVPLDASTREAMDFALGLSLSVPFR